MSNKNAIIERRAALGLSQRALAKLVGTSQQQIQRIEAGVQTVRLDLAARIAEALESSLAEVFPELPKRKSKLRRRKSPARKEPVVEIADSEFLKAGIDTDPRHWTIRVGFVGGYTRLYSVSAAEKERVSSIIWKAPFDFFVFDSKSTRVALNRTAITYCNFCFDVGVVDDEDEGERYDVVVQFYGHSEPVAFGVDPDEAESESDDEGFRSQLQNLFFHIEGTSSDEDKVLWFDDEDGERVYLRTKQIVSLEVPLLCCEPKLWRNHLDSIIDDDDHADAEAPKSSGGASQ